jgi:aminoglycoside 6'-N-acetyltransferase
LARVTVLEGALVRLRPATRDDVSDLAEIRRTPEVYERWRGGDDLVAAVDNLLMDLLVDEFIECA